MPTLDFEQYLTKQQETIDLLAAYAMTQKDAAAGLTAQPLHGQAGLFNTPGLDNQVISTVVRPMGIGSIIPAFPSLDTNPKFGILAGVSDDIGSEPVNVCDDAPTGTYQVGTQSAAFGRVTRDTETIDIGQVNLKLNRGDFTDLMLNGALLGGTERGLQYPSNLNDGNLLNILTQSQMVNAGVRMQRKLTVLNWYGDPVNNTGNGGYKEYPGLASQISTGKVDADDGVTALPTIDSLVIDAAFTDIASYDMVGALAQAENYIYQLGQDTVGEFTAAFFMNSTFWQQITEVYPCQYNTGSCAASLDGTSASRVVIDGRENIMERDAMRRGMYIVINGRTYPVVVDSGIHLVDNTEDATNVPVGQYASDLFFAPLTIAGGLPVLYYQYVDFQAAGSDISLLNNTQSFWTDGGRFYWATEFNNYCYKLKIRVEPRIILRTPQLAFRIDNLLSNPSTMLNRAAIPTEPGYVDGGRTAGMDWSVGN